MPPRGLILLVMGEYWMADTIQELLQLAMPGYEYEIIQTEWAFRNWLSEAKIEPKAVVMNLWFRWCNPAPVMPECPPEVTEEGFRLAGRRCLQLMRDNPLTRNVPVVLQHSSSEQEMRAVIGEDVGLLDYYSYTESDTFPYNKLRRLMDIVREP